jgi:hypothetical protein
MPELSIEPQVWLTAYCAALSASDPETTSFISPHVHERASDAADAALYMFLKRGIRR